MNEFKEVFNKVEFDPRIMIRTAQFFIKQLDGHLKNVNHLSEETIKYYCDRLLEIVLTLEEYSNKLYEDLTDEEKALLALEEEKRNEHLYPKLHTSGRNELGVEYVNTLLEKTKERYEKIEDTSIARVAELNKKDNPEI